METCCQSFALPIPRPSTQEVCPTSRMLGNTSVKMSASESMTYASENSKSLYSSPLKEPKKSQIQQYSSEPIKILSRNVLYNLGKMQWVAPRDRQLFKIWSLDSEKKFLKNIKTSNRILLGFVRLEPRNTSMNKHRLLGEIFSKLNMKLQMLFKMT